MRRKNLIARVVYGVVMTAVGLAVLAGLALLVVFAASVVAVSVVALGLMAVMATLTRKPVKVTIRDNDIKADGVLEARKKGSTWEVY